MSKKYFCRSIPPLCHLNPDKIIYILPQIELNVLLANTNMQFPECTLQTIDIREPHQLWYKLVIHFSLGIYVGYTLLPWVYKLVIHFSLGIYVGYTLLPWDISWLYTSGPSGYISWLYTSPSGYKLVIHFSLGIYVV